MNYIKSYPYIVAIILATIFSIVAWYFTPNKYSATTKLGDEFKETDLAIGLNDISAKKESSNRFLFCGIGKCSYVVGCRQEFTK